MLLAADVAVTSVLIASCYMTSFCACIQHATPSGVMTSVPKTNAPHHKLPPERLFQNRQPVMVYEWNLLC